MGYIPYRGEILCSLASYWFQQLDDTLSHHFLEQPSPRIMLVRLAQPIAAEVIVRGYLAGSMLKDVQNKNLQPYQGYGLGIEKMATMLPYQPFSIPFVHLTTKVSSQQHDAPMPLEYFFKHKILTPDQWQTIRAMAKNIFTMGTKRYQCKGWILADSKLEFGLTSTSQITVIDEILTPDASRLWKKDPLRNQPLLSHGLPQSSDKDIARRYLKESKQLTIPPEIIKILTSHYLDVYEAITKKTFYVHNSNNSYVSQNKTDHQVIEQWLQSSHNMSS